MADDTTPLFKVAEIDTMTGWRQYLNNMKTSPWSGTFTREEAEASVKWRKEHISGRYAYEIVPVEPFMTDNDEARKRHDARHGPHRMEDCSDVDCMEAGTRLLHEELNRKFAQEDATEAEGEAAGHG